MSTELQTTKPAANAIAAGPRGLVLQGMDDMWRFAKAVAVSGLAPKGLQSTEAVFVAIEMGSEVGLPPMASIQNIAVINNRPTIWGDAQLAVCQASQQLLGFAEAECDPALDAIFRELCLSDDSSKKKELTIKLAIGQAKLDPESDNFGVTVYVLRELRSPIFSRFTVADAKQARLWKKDGPWSQYPKRMLKFRARSFGLRDAFPDALRGLLTAEEAADLPAVPVQRIRQSSVESFITQAQTADHQPESDKPQRESMWQPTEEEREAERLIDASFEATPDAKIPLKTETDPLSPETTPDVSPPLQSLLTSIANCLVAARLEAISGMAKDGLESGDLDASEFEAATKAIADRKAVLLAAEARKNGTGRKGPQQREMM